MRGQLLVGLLLGFAMSASGMVLNGLIVPNMSNDTKRISDEDILKCMTCGYPPNPGIATCNQECGGVCSYCPILGGYGWHSSCTCAPNMLNHCTDAYVAANQPLPPASTCVASPPTPSPPNAFAGDDPHLEGVSGDKFDVNQPGEYTLVRVPADRALPAKLEVNASLKATGSSPCGLYIQEIQLSGAWLDESVVRVVPLQRDMPGSNGAGNKTLRPFSLQVESGWHGAAAIHNELWAKEFTKRLSERVHVQSLWKQAYAEAGRVKEAEAFQFLIKGGTAQVDTSSVMVSQASHQALDIEAAGLLGLGFKQLGGLLGTEGHEKHIENLTSECAAFRKMNTGKRSLPENEQGSTMTASLGKFS